ncbi:MAG TPA: NAD(P)/FAD-dependent oxidoreductase [Solirubrobacteraceae bacterium]|nr:NAD(P)/FAD-dependent oxidoreductase [Solirubrobacteraceae bacterium]
MRTTASDHVDVLIVGAGLSGIGAACHLQRRCPDRSYALLEGREAIGGTWDLFRYPGVRSDSDMHTLGYSFRPWTDDRVIADGPSIRRYIADTAEDHGVMDHVRLGHRVTRADWSSEDARWTVTADHDGETVTMTASFLLWCSGYYRYDQGYEPDFAGRDRFRGTIVHPQHWPQDLGYAGKRVAVIGSGATAITLVPAMAETAAHVAMVQRSPTYLVSLPGEDPLATRLRRRLPAMAAYQAVRWKNVGMQALSYRLCRRFPRASAAIIRKAVARQVPAGTDVDRHFRPRYDPWDQRLCVCPDGDFFRALRDGTASVHTDAIESFTETGLRLAGGEEIEADIVVTATGLNLLALGGTEVSVDGRELNLPERLTYKGLMLDGVPNAAMVIGYTNASWTLKCDLTCEYVCRILNHMRDHGQEIAVPVAEPGTVSPAPLLDLQSGYVQRSLDEFPRQGSEPPWKLRQNYPRDILTLRTKPLQDGVLRFAPAGQLPGAASAAVTAPAPAVPAAA